MIRTLASFIGILIFIGLAISEGLTVSCGITASYLFIWMLFEIALR